MIFLLIFDGLYDSILQKLKIIRAAKVLLIVTKQNQNENSQNIEDNLVHIGNYDINRVDYIDDMDIKSIFTSYKPDIVMLV